MDTFTVEQIANLNAALKRRDETIIKQADEIAELKAELAAIKPSWDDAPEWSEWKYEGELNEQ